ncbi:hypothetical protein HID58_067249 [Brassica napus]|uniref:Uncharacterized protein n=1 Tax=Brassica napus TaxID=3708 RepID=A0ABQ7ZHZ9_BRANA|nr:hypothetical protein HID58_067249 [Brassica napus]
MDPILIAIFFGTLGALEIFCPGVMDDPTSRRVPLLWKGQGVTGSAIVSTWLIEDFESFLRSDPFRVYAEDWSLAWSFTGKMRYLIMLLGTPYLARVFRVPRYLTTCGDYTCGPSPSPSCGMKLLWAEPAGAYESSTLNSSLELSSRGSGSPDMMLCIWALNRKDSGI